MYSIILAAVDGSVRSRGVLEAALEICQGSTARVHLFRAVEVPPDFPAAAHMPPDTLPAFLEKEARDFMIQLAAGRPRVEIENPDMTNPKPWRAVLQAAARLNADLIVIGSHGHGGWDRLLATNAARVADFSDRSVLIVHERPAS
jgi:nucleotide-binding universal stress UspA family protein